MQVDNCIYIFLDLGSRGAGPDKDIGIIVATQPVVVAGVIKGPGFTDGANEAEMELGLIGHIADDAGNLEGVIVTTYLQRAADDIGGIEVAQGGGLIDHDRMRIVEVGIGVARDHGQGEDLEDRRVGEGKVMVEDMVVALPYQQVAHVAKPDHLLDLRIGSSESGAEKFGGGGGGVLGIIEVAILIDPIDAIGVDVVAVVTELIGDVQNNQ